MSTNPDLQEPAALWPDAPRLCPHLPFPAYRFVSGLNPHPSRNSAEHGCSASSSVVSLMPEQWGENENYLYGIDLYHQGYLWESHEAWESLWRLLPRSDPQARLLQALIRNSAAQIKAHAGAIRGVHVHSRQAYELLSSVLSSDRADSDGRFMGLDLVGLLSQMDRHYGRVWRPEQSGTLILDGSPPRLELG